MSKSKRPDLPADEQHSTSRIETNSLAGLLNSAAAVVPSWPIILVRKGLHEVGGGASAGRAAAEWRRPNRPWPNRALFTLIDRPDLVCSKTQGHVETKLVSPAAPHCHPRAGETKLVSAARCQMPLGNWRLAGDH